MDENEYYETRHRQSEAAVRMCCYCFIGICIALLLSFLFSGCKSIKYVPVETVKTEIRHHHDTIRIQDSIRNEVQTIIREADSAEIERLMKDYGFKLDKAQKTILILRKELEQKSNEKSESKTDSVIKEKEVQVPYPVEKPLTRWQQICIDYGKLTMGATVLFVLFILAWIARRLKQI